MANSLQSMVNGQSAKGGWGRGVPKVERIGRTAIREKSAKQSGKQFKGFRLRVVIQKRGVQMSLPVEVKLIELLSFTVILSFIEF